MPGGGGRHTNLAEVGWEQQPAARGTFQRPSPDRASANRSWSGAGMWSQGDRVELLPNNAKEMPDIFISQLELNEVLLNITSYQLIYFCTEQICYHDHTI